MQWITPDPVQCIISSYPGPAFRPDSHWHSTRRLPKSDRLGDVGRLVAHLGGYRGRKHDPEPDNQIMWHGQSRLSWATLGHQILRIPASIVFCLRHSSLHGSFRIIKGTPVSRLFIARILEWVLDNSVNIHCSTGFELTAARSIY